MKTLLTVIVLVFALSVSGQVDELKTYIDSQKEFTQVPAGERWVDLFVDTEFERKGLGDSVILTVALKTGDTDYITTTLPAVPQITTKWFMVNDKEPYRYFINKNFIIGDTTFVPRQNRHSFRKVYLENGVVKYQQLYEMLVIQQTDKPKEEILINFNRKAKLEGVKDKDFKEVQEYILKGKAVAGDSIHIDKPKEKSKVK
jgi:hypothetical protein